MATRFIQSLRVEPPEQEELETRHRDALFNHAKKAVNHLSRHPSDRSALRSLVTCVKQIAEKLGDDEDEKLENECECDDPDNCDCEDESADLQAREKAKKHSVNSRDFNQYRGHDAVVRELAKQRGQQSQPSRHDNRRRHPDPVVNAMTEHRSNDAVLAGIERARAARNFKAKR